MENNKMTEEQVKSVVNVLRDCETEEDKLVKSLPSNNGIEEATDNNAEPVTEKEIVVTNPITGITSVVNEREKSSIEEDSELKIDAELEKLLNIDEDEAFTIPESVEDIQITEDQIRDNAVANGADISEIGTITEVIRKYRNTKDKNSVYWYDLLPSSVQEMILKECKMVNNTSRKAINLFASEFLESIVRDSKLDSVIIDMQKSLAKAYDMSPLMEIAINSQKTIFEEKLSGNIDILKKKLEDDSIDENTKSVISEKITTLEGIRNSYYQSYTFEDMITKIKDGKIRVKAFDIKKYKRYCENFLYKYTGDTPFIIHNINNATTVLLRKFKYVYDPDQIIAFIIAFIKYTQNMNANDVVDHTFMSYFVSNIINLDLIKTNDNQESFSNVLLKNIEEGIKAINNI